MGRDLPSLDPALAQTLAARAAAAAATETTDAAETPTTDAATLAQRLAAVDAERLAAAAAGSPIEDAAARLANDTAATGPTLADDRAVDLDDLASATTVVAGTADRVTEVTSTSLAGDQRAGAFDLPGLDTLGALSGHSLPGLPTGGSLGGTMPGAGGLTNPLDSSPDTSGGPHYGTDMIGKSAGGFGSDVTLADAFSHPFATGAKLLVDAADAAADAAEDAADTVHDATTTARRYADAAYESWTDDDEDSDAAGSDSAPSGSGTEGGDSGGDGTSGGESSGEAPAGTDASGDDEWERWDELAPKTEGPMTKEEYDAWQAAVAEMQSDGGDDDGDESGSAGSGGAAGSVGYYVNDGEGGAGLNPYAGSYGTILTGLTGRASGGGGSTDPSDPNAPSGGDTTVNPSPDGVAAAGTRGSTVHLGSAVDWVGQPKPVDGSVVVPRVIESPTLGAAPETVNPGTGDAQMADSDAQASTAYQPPSIADGTANTTTVAEDITSDDAASAGPSDDAGSAGLGGAGSALDDTADDHGRDFGMSHRDEHGHGPFDAQDAGTDGDADLGDGAG